MILVNSFVSIMDYCRFNLDPFGKYPDEQLWLALQKARLFDYTSKLPERLDFLITRGGANLSLGHRQLFCLAR